MLQYYITVSFRQFTETLISCFYLSAENKNLETCIPVWFEQLKELKQFWGTFAGWCFSQCTLSQKMQNTMFTENYYM